MGRRTKLPQAKKISKKQRKKTLEWSSDEDDYNLNIEKKKNNIRNIRKSAKDKSLLDKLSFDLQDSGDNWSEEDPDWFFPKEDDNNKETKSRNKKDKSGLCPQCGKVVTNLTLHIKYNHSNDFSCDQCYANFKSQKLLDEHKEVHNSDNPHKCDLCNLIFKNVTKLALHRFVHSGSYDCPICGFTATSKFRNSIIAHIKRHEDNFSVRCEICNKGFLCKKKLEEHIEWHENIPKYECEICHKKFPVKSYLTLHNKFNHKKELYGTEEIFQCEICGRNFTFEKSFKRHLSCIHKIGKDLTVRCQVCYKVIANNHNLKKHMKVHTGEKNYSCDVCGKTFSQKQYVTRHQRVHQPDREGGRKKPEASEYKIETLLLPLYVIVPDGVDKKSFLSKIIIETENNEKFKKHKKQISKQELCNICGEMVKHYQRHIQKHIFTCQQCFVSFKSEKKLKYHQEVHNNENQFNCGFCTLKFQSAVKLALHKYIHTKKYICPICGFEGISKSSASIRTHILRHDDNFKFRCEICAKGFLNSSKLQDHLEVHQGNKKYECEMCHKKFAVKNYLKLHIGHMHKKEVFGIEEMYQCEICGRKFSFEKSFRRHMSTIHKIGKDLTKECPVCHKIIANTFNLKVHMRIHTGEKNYACEKCGKRFSDMKYVRKHQSVHLRETRMAKSEKETSNNKVKLEKLLHINEEFNLIKIVIKQESQEETYLRKTKIKRKGKTNKWCLKEEDDEKPLRKKERKVRIKKEKHDSPPKLPKNQKANMWTCKFCFSTFSSRKEMFEHRKEHVGEEKSRPDEPKKYYFDIEHEIYVCNNCSAECQDLDEIEKHVEIHENKFTCDECQEDLYGPINYTVHVQKHRDDKMFPCPWCQYMSQKKEAMQVHINRLHLQIYDFQCTKCGKCFNDALSFKEHDNVHLNLKPFSCVVCSKAFFYSRYLLSHQLRTHTVRVLDPESKTQCNICQKIFARLDTLEKHYNAKHLTVRTGPYEKKHLCDVCGQGFSRPDKLKIHYRKHTGEKPYSCVYCSKSFIKRDYLIMHERIHSGEKPYSCEICGKCFNQGAPLRIHLRSHTGERPYVCPYCGAGSVSRGALNSHIKSCIATAQVMQN